MEKLSVKGIACAFGISWGVYVLCIGWMSWLFNWGTPLAVGLSSLYIGYGPSFIGGIIGGIYGFIDGAVGGIIIAWIYNWVIAPKRSSSSSRRRRR